MSKLVCMLRVKDGMLFNERWMNNIAPLIDKIVVVDNGSTDGTYEFFKNNSKVGNIIRTEGFHEGRDRRLLLEMARNSHADWLIGLDIDEVFEESLSRGILERMMRSKVFKSYGFRRYHMIRDEYHFMGTRRDLLELSSPSRYLFLNTSKLYIRDVKIHCGVEGLEQPRLISRYRIKHLCNLELDYRINTYKNYLQIDPQNKETYIRDLNLLNQIPKRIRSFKLSFIGIAAEYVLLTIIYIIRLPLRKIIRFLLIACI